MLCPECGSNNREGAKFCDECGRRLIVVPAVVVADDSRDGAVSEPKKLSLPEINEERPSKLSLPAIEQPLESVFAITGEEPAQIDEVKPFDYATFSSVSSQPYVASSVATQDDKLADASYQPPASWRTGDTMELPRITENTMSTQTTWSAPDPNARKMKRIIAREERAMKKREKALAKAEKQRQKLAAIEMITPVIEESSEAAFESVEQTFQMDPQTQVSEQVEQTASELLGSNDVQSACQDVSADVVEPDNAPEGEAAFVSEMPSEDIAIEAEPDAAVPNSDVAEEENELPIASLEQEVSAASAEDSCQDEELIGEVEVSEDLETEVLIGASMETPASAERETPLELKTSPVNEVQQVSFSTGQPSVQPKERSRSLITRGRVVAVVAGAALVVGLGAGLSYQYEIWGGKTLPDVVGLTQADASYILDRKDFKVEEVEAKSDETEGLIIAMEPSAGSRLEAGSTITISVSKARIMPDIVGMDLAEAKSALKAEGLTNVRTVAIPSEKDRDTVLKCSIKKGDKVSQSEEIALTLAGPYVVPDVSGLSFKEARSLLEDGGYVVAETKVSTDEVEEGTVIDTVPAAQDELAAGSLVVCNIAYSRSSELVELTKDYLGNVGVINAEGIEFEIISVDSAKPASKDSVSFSITCIPRSYLDGQLVYGSEKTKTGTATWDANNNITLLTLE